MPREVKKSKEEKREEKYRQRTARQVEAAIDKRRKSAVSRAKRVDRMRRVWEHRKDKRQAAAARRQSRLAARRAFRVRRNTPIFLTEYGPPPAYLQNMPEVWRRSQRRVSPSEKRRDFFRAFGLTALVLACPILALWGMGEAYEAVRVNGFADYTAPLGLYTVGNVQGIRIFDYVLQPDRLPSFIQIGALALWKLTGPAVQLVAQALWWIPRLLLCLVGA